MTSVQREAPHAVRVAGGPPAARRTGRRAGSASTACPSSTPTRRCAARPSTPCSRYPFSTTPAARPDRRPAARVAEAAAAGRQRELLHRSTCSTTCGWKRSARTPAARTGRSAGPAAPPRSWSSGNVCTRPCGFCSVPKGEPLARRGRRAGARRRGRGPAGAEARRHHVRDPRRPARRRGRPLLPLRRWPSASADRGRGRGADARLPRRPGRHRPRDRAPARRCSTTTSRRCRGCTERSAAGPTTAAASTCSTA